jgi:tricorn protease
LPPCSDWEQTPKDVIAGRDPQLERAIAVALEELTKNPAPRPKRPPYPIKDQTLRGTASTSTSDGGR